MRPNTEYNRTLPLLLLPKDVVQFILKSSILSAADVGHFGATCTAFWILIHEGLAAKKIALGQRGDIRMGLSWTGESLFVTRRSHNPCRLFAVGCNRNDQFGINQERSYWVPTFTQCHLPRDFDQVLGISLGIDHTFIYGLNARKKMLLAIAGCYDDPELISDPPFRLLPRDKALKKFTSLELPKDLAVIFQASGGPRQIVICGLNRAGAPLVLANGWDESGQLGVRTDEAWVEYGHRTDRPWVKTFTPVYLPQYCKQVTQVSVSYHHTLLFGSDVEGKALLMGAGSNHQRQLGFENENSCRAFKRLSLPQELVSVSKILAIGTLSVILGENDQAKPLLAITGKNEGFVLVNAPAEFARVIGISGVDHNATRLYIWGVAASGKPLLASLVGFNWLEKENGIKTRFDLVKLPECFAQVFQVAVSEINLIVYGLNSEKKAVLAVSGDTRKINLEPFDMPELSLAPIPVCLPEDEKKQNKCSIC